MKILKRYIESLWIAPFCHTATYGIALVVAIQTLEHRLEMLKDSVEPPCFDLATAMIVLLLFSSHLGWAVNVIWRVTHGKWISTTPSMFALLLCALMIFVGMRN